MIVLTRLAAHWASVIIVHESLTQSHDHLPQTAGWQQGMMAGPLSQPPCQSHFPAVHPGGGGHELPGPTPFHVLSLHAPTSSHSGFPPQPQRSTQRGGGRPALAATFSTRAAALAAVPAAPRPPAQARALMSIRAARSKQVKALLSQLESLTDEASRLSVLTTQALLV